MLPQLLTGSLSSSVSLDRAASASQDVFTDLSGVRNQIQSAEGDDSLKKVAQQFESMFINILLKNMRSANAVFEKDSLFQSQESQFYRDMHDHQLSLTLSQKPGLGIADMLYQQLRNQYGSGEENMELKLDKGFVGRETQLSPYENTPAKRVAIANDKYEFLDRIVPHLKKAAEALGVEKELLAAQAALETGWGQFMLANEKGEAGNNLFNIKRDANWQGESVRVHSLEEHAGLMHKEDARFKVYADLEESAKDYVKLIQDNPRYHPSREADSSEDYIQKLQAAGYATDSRYAEKIVDLYKQIKSMLGAGK